MADAPPQTSSGRAKGWLVQAAVLAALVVAIGLWQARFVPSGEAPLFRLPSLSGAQLDSRTLRGMPTVLVFWAPWCGVCRLASGNVSWLRALVGDTANVISIASHYERPADVQRYVAEQQVDYPVLLDQAGTARRYGVRAYPTLVFLDTRGEIPARLLGTQLRWACTSGSSSPAGFDAPAPVHSGALQPR